jgi:hypothetical protein
MFAVAETWIYCNTYGKIVNNLFKNMKKNAIARRRRLRPTVPNNLRQKNKRKAGYRPPLT